MCHKQIVGLISNYGWHSVAKSWYNIQLLVYTANQPIAWQQLKAFVNVNGVKTTLWSANKVTRIRKRGDCLMVALSTMWQWLAWFFGARWAGFSQSTFGKPISWDHSTAQMRKNIRWAAVVRTIMAHWHLGLVVRIGLLKTVKRTTV